MGRSVVYFTDMRATPERNLLQKFRALIERAGIADINFEKQFTAIKIHLGEPGNIAYLRPNFAKVVADKVKELGGKPFLTDSNTLYVGAGRTRSSTSRPPTRTATTPSAPAATSS